MFFFFPPLSLDDGTTLSIDARGIRHTDGDKVISEHEFPAPLTAAIGVTAAVGAVGVLGAVGVPTALAAGAVAGASALVNVDSYTREDGTEVQAHRRTPPDGIEENNFSA